MVTIARVIMASSFAARSSRASVSPRYAAIQSSTFSMPPALDRRQDPTSEKIRIAPSFDVARMTALVSYRARRLPGHAREHAVALS